MKYEFCPKCGEKQESDWGKCKKCGYEEDNNNIAYALKIIGYVILCLGISGGFMLGMKYPIISPYSIKDKFNWIIFMICTFSSVISGVIFLAFSEIIVMEQRIFEIMKK